MIRGGITISKHPKIYFLNDKDEVRHAMTSADFNLASKKLNLSDLLVTKPVHFNGTSVNSFCTPFSNGENNAQILIDMRPNI